jgi:WD40 repeat protein
MCIVFSLDRKTIASASGDGTVRIWDAITGAAVVQALQRHVDVVNSVMFSLDSGKLVSGSADNTIRVWDLTTGVQTSVLYHMTVTSLGFSPDGQQIISGLYDRTI